MKGATPSLFALSLTLSAICHLIMKFVYTVLVAGILIWCSCKHDSFYDALEADLRDLVASRAATGSGDYFILPQSDDFANIPQSEANPLTAEKVALGKLLFFEPCFAVEAKEAQNIGTFTCASCHVPTAGFRPNRIQGIADGAFGFGEKGEARYKLPIYKDSEIDAQGARPLAVINTAYSVNSMWNGSFGHNGANVGTESRWGVSDSATVINHERLGSLEGQNIAGLKVHRLLINRDLVEFYGYKPYFDAAFPDIPEDERYNRKTASFAISAYLRTLLTNEAPFQHWLKGDKNALSEEEKRGALLFFGKAGCYRCHHDPNLGAMEFHALGVLDLFENGGLKTDINDPRNQGRGGFTGKTEDLYKFRVPQLYNMADSGPYFHGSSKKSLGEVLEYFNNGMKENARVPQSQISPFFHPLNLEAHELRQLAAFLANGLRDPNLQRYVPEKVVSGFCFPNNDPISRQQMNCH